MSELWELLSVNFGGFFFIVCLVLVLLKFPLDVKVCRISPLVIFISACFILNSGVIIISYLELLSFLDL